MESFEEQAYSFGNRSSWDKTWVAAAEDGVIVLGEGFGYPIVSKWSVDQEKWINLIDPDRLESQISDEDPKLSYLRAASFTDVLALNGHLYITTTSAACTGLFRFNLAGGVPFEYEDFTVIQDRRIGEDQCLQGMYYDKERDNLYIYTRQRVVKFE